MILISQLLLLKCILKSAFHAELSLSGFILDENIDMLGSSQRWRGIPTFHALGI